MFNLVACTIVRNEAPYLYEWVAFHQLQGIEHFYFYEGGSTDSTLAILGEFEAMGVATINSSPENTIKTQMQCYNHYLDKHKKEACWTAFIDTDEFLFSPKGQLLPVINELNASAIAVHWMLYGSNGKLVYDPKELVVARFTKRENKVHTHVKSICYNEEVIRAGGSPHIFKVEGDDIVNERGEKLSSEYALMQRGSVEKLRINHYHTKSYAEYVARRSGRFTPQQIKDRFVGHDLNEVEDGILLPFIEPINALITEYKNY